MLARLRSFARALTRRRDFEAALEEEIEFHLEARAADLARTGLSPDEARRRARLELGARETYREQCREARGLRLVDEVRADLRYAWRGLRGNPGFSLVAILTLGLAMAANLAFFTFFDAFVLRPLPIAGADRYVDLSLVDERGQFADRFTREEIEGLTSALAPAFERMYGASFFRLPLFEPQKRLVHGQAVSAGYFSLLEATPAFGRGFLSAEDGSAGQEAPAVLSDSGWQKLFRRDPAVLGRKLRLGATWFTVVGVMGPDFYGLEPITPEIWIPLGAHRALASRLADSPTYDLAGTLRPGTSREQAAELAMAALASLGTRAGQLAGPGASEASSQAAAPGKIRVRVEPRKSWLQAGDQRGMAVMGALLFTAFILVLLIACANLASLHLARASARHREIATRLSLGSSRLRLVRQLLTESLLLSALGAALGAALAFPGTGELHRRVFAVVTSAGLTLTPISFHWHVLAYAAGLAVAAGVAFGLLPALVATSTDLAGAARRDAPSLGGRVRRQRWTGALIAAQVAGSLVLLTLAGLLLRTVRASSRLDAGFDTQSIVEVRYPNPTPEVAERLRREPEIAGLTGIAHTPLSGTMPRQSMLVDGQSRDLHFNFVDHNYFGTLGIRVQEGRTFWPEEAEASSQVLVVSAATARLLWPGASAVGRTIEIEPEESPVAPGRYEVVGVVEDVISGFFFQGRDASAVYFPAAVGSPRIGELLVRPRGDTVSLVRRLGEVCGEIDPAVLCEPTPLARWADLQRIPFVAASVIAGALGLLALGLTAIGLHGLVAFAVVQRLRELGVRIALGASSAKVLSTVLARALGSVLIGVAVGLPACWLLSRATGKLFIVLAGFDALGLVGAPFLLVLIALVAALIPARRATGADPVVSLRAN